MVYLSGYSKYPIYEAAEGGYYYEGIELVESERMSLRKAKQTIKEWLADEEGMEGWSVGPNFHPENLNLLPGVRIYRNGQYIGEGEFWVIERKKGCFTRGYHPYC